MSINTSNNANNAPVSTTQAPAQHMKIKDSKIINSTKGSSAKTIVKFLTSETGKTYINQQPYDRLDRIEKHLQDKTQNPGVLRKISDFFRKLKGKTTNTQHYESSLAMVKDVKKGKIEDFCKEKEEFFSHNFTSETNKHEHVNAILVAKDTLAVGESKEIKTNEKTYYVNVVERDGKKDVNLIAVEVNHFATGGFSQIYEAKSSKNSEDLIMKEARNNDKSQISLRREIENLQLINGGKINVGIQRQPHAIVKVKKEADLQDGAATDYNVKGYLLHKYAGDGVALLKKMREMPSNVRIKTAIDLEKSINQGVDTVFEKGLFHFDQKLENTLYEATADGFEIVISDFGEDVRRDEMDQLLTEYHHTSQLLNDKDKPLSDEDANSALVDRNVARAQLIGGHTLTTTHPDDIDILKDILRESEKKPLTPALQKECVDTMINIAEKRIVFSNAFVYLALLCGSDEDKLRQESGLFVDAGAPHLKEFKSFEEFNAALMKYSQEQQPELGLEMVPQAHIQIIYQSLNNDYTQRPSWKEYTAACAA